jgi:dihydrofolate reductase
MRTLVMFHLTTVDGFFSDSGGRLDWHVADDQIHAFGSEQRDSVDTILFGRVTFQRMVGFRRPIPRRRITRSSPSG